MLQHYDGTDVALNKEWITGLGVVQGSPAMRGEYPKVNAAMRDALAQAIAARVGVDVTRDIYPQILAGAVTAASQVAVRRWFAADPPVPLRPLLRLALQQLALACSGQSEG
jgi:hypothetical protein